MEIRFLEPNDVETVKRIYEQFFLDMEFPNFYNGFHCAFVAHNNGNIIAVGGLKPIAEAVVLTDKNASVRSRRDALLNIYTALTYSAEKLKYKRIHAFTFDEQYSNHLINRMRFTPIKQSKMLVLELENG